VEERPVVTRSGRTVVRPSRFAAVMKVATKEWQQEQSKIAIRKELKQLFEELVAIVPVKRQQIPKDASILNSHMFLVDKYDAEGKFEKVKARLVADGRDQDPTLYPNKSSPTVAIHSVFAVLGMAVEKHWRIVIKIDIKGAFVQTPMSGPPIFMKLDPKIMRYAKEMYPVAEIRMVGSMLVHHHAEGDVRLCTSECLVVRPDTIRVRKVRLQG
jgi:hypothetical protein